MMKIKQRIKEKIRRKRILRKMWKRKQGKKVERSMMIMIRIN